MLRNDAIYLVDKDLDSRVPTTETIKDQVINHTDYVYGSVRLATGRVIGSDYRKASGRKNSQKKRT